MNIVVCIKQVPDTKGGVKFNPDGTLDRAAMLTIMNPDDKAGLEAALRLKEQYGAEVTVLTMGLPKADEVLREAMAMGADKGILVTDRVLGGADTWATSTTIAGALRNLDYDLIITGRGGGSMEDLWAFNDERVARAIFDSEIPVISAVGHEPDVTISDYVADLRAATPSNAAELAVPDQQELRKKLSMMQASMEQSVQKTLKLSRQRLTGLAEKRALQSPLNYVEDRRVLLDFLSTRLHAAGQKMLHEKKQRFVRLTAALDAMSPLKVLSRGYSMVTDEAGTLVTSAGAVEPGQRIHVSLRSGSLTAQVTQIQEEDRHA